MKNLYLLIASRFLLSFYFSVPIQTLFLLLKGIPFSQMMILEAVLLISILIWEIPTGIAGDKMGRKWSLVVSGALTLFAWIPWFLADNVYMFGASFFISGCAIAFSSGSDRALIYDQLKLIEKSNEMQRITGYYYGSMTFGTAIAGLIGAYIASSHTLESFYLVYKLTVIAQLVGFLLMLFLKEPNLATKGSVEMHEPEQKESMFKSGLKLIKSNANLQKIALLSIFSLPFSFVLIYAFQIYFQQSNVPPEWYGWAIFIAAIFSTVTTMLAYKLERLFGVNKGTLIACLLPAIFWIVMAYVFHPVLAVMLYILNESASKMRNPLFSDYLNQHIPSKIRATVLSTISMVECLYSLIIRPIVGFIGDVSMSYMFITIGIIIIVGTFLFQINEDHVNIMAEDN